MDAYASFAQRIADSVTEVRGCLILSRDGFVLGSYPDEDEGLAKSAWLRFAGLGESERGVVEFPTAIWAFVHRGPYSAFAVAVPGVRPGVLIDRIEDVLVEAERSRGQVSLGPGDPDHAAAAAPPPPPAPIEPIEPNRPPAEPDEAFPLVTPGQTALDLEAPQAPKILPEIRPEVRPEPEIRPQIQTEREPEMEILLASAEQMDSPSQLPQGGDGDESEIDRFLLAKEFTGLLQVDRPDDEVPG